MSKLVLDAIGKYIHPTRYRHIVETESLNQLTWKEQRFGRKTRNTVLPLSEFSTNRGSRAVSLTGAYKSFKETRVQRWMRLHRRGLVVQLLAQHCHLKLWKGQACLHPKRLWLKLRTYQLRGQFIGWLNLRYKRTIFSGVDMDNGRPFWEIPISNFKREEQQIF